MSELLSLQSSEFYWEPTFRCGIHPSKPSGFVVKRQGEVYRQACDEKCAMTQALELDKALASRKETTNDL